ncbi:MAG: flagellar protein FlgN [Bdellovibrionales bacterium]|nr:flagellar protein FlgN [Bdellovibrionales bacterium]
MKAYKELVTALDQLVTVYRHLLDVVRKEHEALLAADHKEIPIINDSKEKMLLKIRKLDAAWEEHANELMKGLKMDNSRPRLLDIAAQFEGDDAQKLQQLHSVLNMLVQRISEINKKNEVLAKAALSHISGAMASITETLNANPTYEKGGDMKEKVEGASGRLVQREA